MFELTDTLTYAVPVMLSVLVAKTVADALEPKGIYYLVIEYALTSRSFHLALILFIAESPNCRTSTRKRPSPGVTRRSTKWCASFISTSLDASANGSPTRPYMLY